MSLTGKRFLSVQFHNFTNFEIVFTFSRSNSVPVISSSTSCNTTVAIPPPIPAICPTSTSCNNLKVTSGFRVYNSSVNLHLQSSPPNTAVLFTTCYLLPYRPMQCRGAPVSSQRTLATIAGGALSPDTHRCSLPLPNTARLLHIHIIREMMCL